MLTAGMRRKFRVSMKMTLIGSLTLALLKAAYGPSFLIHFQ